MGWRRPSIKQLLDQRPVDVDLAVMHAHPAQRPETEKCW